MNRRKKKGPRATDHIDICIASHFAALRAARGLTQRQVAATIGVSYQQIQKYETASSRIARVLDVPVATFYTGLPD